MSEPNLQTVCYMPLSVAVLCQDCSAVSNGVNVCPACGSKAIASVAPWLERKPPLSERFAFRVIDNKPQIIKPFIYEEAGA